MATEAALYRRAGTHPNLVRLYGVSYFQPSPPPPLPPSQEGQECLVASYARYGSLDNVLAELSEPNDSGYYHHQRRRLPLSLGEKLTVAHQIACGMQHLHTQGLIHRDLAPRNVLVVAMPSTEDYYAWQVQLTDYGLSKAGRVYYSSPENENLPQLWMSPEALKRRRFSASADVWAFGITLWELLNDGAFPYYMWAAQDSEVLRRVMCGETMPLDATVATAFEEHGPVGWGGGAEVVRLLRACWGFEPAARPDFATLEMAIAEVRGMLEDSWPGLH